LHVVNGSFILTISNTRLSSHFTYLILYIFHSLHLSTEKINQSCMLLMIIWKHLFPFSSLLLISWKFHFCLFLQQLNSIKRTLNWKLMMFG